MHALVAIAALFLSACGLDDTCDPTVENCVTADGQYAYTGDLGIDTVAWGCCDPDRDDRCDRNGLFWYDITSQGRMGKVELTIQDNEGRVPWSEAHEVKFFDADPDGWWEDRYLELAVVDTSSCTTLSDCADLQRADLNTLFPCEASFTERRMTWWLRVYDTDDVLHRCVGWGQRPELHEDCTEWTFH